MPALVAASPGRKRPAAGVKCGAPPCWRIHSAAKSVGLPIGSGWPKAGAEQHVERRHVENCGGSFSPCPHRVLADTVPCRLSRRHLPGRYKTRTRRGNAIRARPSAPTPVSVTAWAGSAPMPATTQRACAAIGGASRLASRDADDAAERARRLGLLAYGVPSGAVQYLLAIGSSSAGNNVITRQPLSVTTTSSSMRAAE